MLLIEEVTVVRLDEEVVVAVGVNVVLLDV